jgi:hypothetical protein
MPSEYTDMAGYLADGLYRPVPPEVMAMLDELLALP